MAPINVDMGAPIVVHAFAWGIVCPDLYPTLTLHASNNAEFMRDHTVIIPSRTVGTVFGNNTHEVANDATLLWQLHLNHTSGSQWNNDDIQNNTIDLYYTRLTSNPRYSRLAADGSIAVEDCTALFTGHITPVVDFTPNAFRYFAFTVSVGRAVGITDRHILEIMKMQLVIEAPPPAVLDDSMVALYGRGPLNALAPTESLLQVTLSKDLPSEPNLYGYVEVWTRFRTRGYFSQGNTGEITTSVSPSLTWTSSNDPQRGPMSQLGTSCLKRVGS